MYFQLTFPFSEKDLKTEFRRLSKLYHPDIIGGDGRVFLDVQKEYDDIKAGKVIPAKKAALAKKINKWKFYEFFSLDTHHINMYLPQDAFREGATVFLMEKGGGKEIRITLSPDTNAPVATSFLYRGRIYDITANIQNEPNQKR